MIIIHDGSLLSFCYRLPLQLHPQEPEDRVGSDDVEGKEPLGSPGEPGVAVGGETENHQLHWKIMSDVKGLVG